ncbi:MAG: hypothetical protein ABI760_10800 [Ferruginibacter sp.]
MQKLMTVSVDTKQLVQSPTNPFTINEIDSVNELLEQGWEIEQFEVLKGGTGNGDILLLVILNDDSMFDKEDDFDDEFGFDEENDMDDDDDDDPDEIRRMKKV